MTDEPYSADADRDGGLDADRDFDTTSGGLNDETAVSARMARSAGPRSAAAPARGSTDEAPDDTESTIRVDRAPRPAVPRYAPPPDVTEGTVVRPRSAKGSEDATVRVRRTTANPVEPQTDDEHDSPEPEAEASADRSPTRLAYSPDPEELAAGYAARHAAPVIASRAGHPLRMAQPPIDGEAVDRSVRGKARRRAVSLGAAVAFSIVVVACLLGALIASFGH